MVMGSASSPPVDAAPDAVGDVGAEDVKAEAGEEAQGRQERWCPYTFDASMSMEPDRKRGRLDGSAVAVLALANNAKVASPYPDWTYARNPEFLQVLNGELALRKDGSLGAPWTQPLVHHLLHCYQSLQIARRAEPFTKVEWEQLAGMLASHPDCVPPRSWKEVRSKFEKLKKRFTTEKMDPSSRWPYFANMLNLQSTIDRMESGDSPVQGSRVLFNLEPAAAGGARERSPLAPPAPPSPAMLLPPAAGPPPPPIAAAAAAPAVGSGAGTEAAVTSVSSRGASHPPLGASGISYPSADRMFRETRLSIRSRISRAPVYGAYCASFAPMIAEILGLAKYDFVVVDLEYGPCDHAHTLPILLALASTGCPSILRLPARASVQVVRRALDLGPSGIMFPDIESAEAARKLVLECRNNAGRPLVRSSFYGTDAARMDANELFIICEVSSVTALSNVAEIASIEGVDCIQIAPLGTSMGIFHDMNQLQDFMRKAEEAVISCNARRRTPVYLAGLATPELTPATLLNLNYHMVSGAVDIALLRDAAMADVANKFKRPPQPNSLTVKPELRRS